MRVPGFHIEKEVQSHATKDRVVYRVFRGVDRRMFKCYRFSVWVAETRGLAYQVLQSLPQQKILSIHELIWPNERCRIERSGVETDVLCLLHSIDLLKRHPSLQQYVYGFDQIFWYVFHDEVYCFQPWFYGATLDDLDGSSEQNKAFDGLVRLFDDFHSAGLCIHDVTLTYTGTFGEERYSRNGNIFFDKGNNSTECKLIDIEAICEIGVDYEKAKHLQSPVWGSTYFPKNIYFALDDAEDRLPNLKQFGWEQDVLSILGILLDYKRCSPKLSETNAVYQMFECMIANRHILDEESLHMVESDEGNAGVQEETQANRAGTWISSIQKRLDGVSVLPRQTIVRSGVLGVVLGVLVLTMIYVGARVQQKQQRTASFDLIATLYETHYINDKYKEDYRSVRTTLQERVKTDDPSSKAMNLFLHAIHAGSACYILEDWKSQKRLMSKLQTTLCKSVLSEVRDLYDANPTDLAVQYVYSYWMQAHCFSSVGVDSKDCSDSTTLLKSIIPELSKRHYWAFVEAHSVLLHRVRFGATDLDVDVSSACTSMLERYDPALSHGRVFYRVKENLSNCFALTNSMPKRIEWAVSFRQRVPDVPIPWFSMINATSDKPCHGWSYKRNPLEWNVSKRGSYCSWLASSLNAGEIYTLPAGLELSLVCRIQNYFVKINDSTSEADCTPDDKFGWIESYDQLVELGFPVQSE